MFESYKESLHILIAVYIVFGWLFAPAIHGPSCIGILVHWLINKNRCILSEGYEDNNGFSSGLLAKVGINIQNNEWLKTIIPYILVSIPASISIYMALNDIQIIGGLAKDIGKYIAPIVPIVLTGSSISKNFAKGIEEGQAKAENIFTDSVSTMLAPAAAIDENNNLKIPALTE